MTRQLDIKAEERETARRLTLVKALEYGLVGALDFHGATLVGLSIKYEPFSSILTLRVEINNQRNVTFITSDCITNCFLTAYTEARNGRLKWFKDKYAQDSV